MKNTFKTMLNISKWLLIGVLIILAFGIIGVGIYALKKSISVEGEFKGEIEEIRKEIRGLKEDVERLKKEISIKPEKPSEIDTSDWKIYKNEKLGIAFKYPKEWKLEKCMEFVKSGFGWNAEKSAFDNPNCDVWIDFVDSYSFYKFSVNTPLKDYFCDENWVIYNPYSANLLSCNEIKTRVGREGILTDSVKCHTVSKPIDVPLWGEPVLDYCEYLRIFYVYTNSEEYPIFVAGKKWGQECFKKECKKFEESWKWKQKTITCMENEYELCKPKNEAELKLFENFIKEIREIE